MENYLIKLSNKAKRFITKFRCCNLEIAVEKGRWYNIELDNRLCLLCNENSVGDEYHYLFICKKEKVLELRKNLVSSYYTQYPSVHKMKYVHVLSYNTF